jgi:hypothetical protein
MTGSRDERAYLRGTQRKTGTNLALRQSVHADHYPRVNLARG